MEGLKAISLTHKHAPIDVREKVSMESEEAGSLLLKLKEVFDVEEALIISTCNRTEIYYSSVEDLDSKIISVLCSHKGISSQAITKHFKLLKSDVAIPHLFKVALGLESKVLGDIQISNQVKRAYQQSADLNLAGSFLRRLMHTIFFANKRVVQETRFQDGTASVASVASDLIDKFVGKYENPRVCLVGLGEIGQNVLENINTEQLQITLLNRTKSKAEAFAKAKGFAVKDLSDLPEVIKNSDVVISAVAAKDYLIKESSHGDKESPTLFIDLSVPRSIQPEIDSRSGVLLYNVDQLTEKTLKAKKVREEAVPDVLEIVEDSLSRFDSWKSEMEVSPTIQRLKSTLDQIRKEELSRYTNVGEEEMKLLEVATKNMMQKLIKLPVLQLKAACQRGEVENLVGVLNDLFNLEEQEAQKK